MIPPVAPGQTEEQNMVGWNNTFNMRQVTLMNIAASQVGTVNRAHLNCMRSGCVTSPSKSLDILRKNLQSAINRDIDSVVKKYLEKFFQPAVHNIRMNLGRNSANDDLLKNVCYRMLEEAKAMYKISGTSRDSSPYDCSDSEIGSLGGENRLEQMSPLQCKRKESDTESENGYSFGGYKRHKYHNSKLKCDSAKWSAERITECTSFIMGARANKVLGFGQTRGRLYIRHPDLVRYSGDNEDKEWLMSKNLMPPNGGKAYLMLLEDIRDLATTVEYRNNPNLQLSELKGFEAPPFMITKIRTYVNSIYNDKKQDSDSEAFESSTSSKQSDINTLIGIPDTSPNSNRSFMSPTNFATVSSILSLGDSSNKNGGCALLQDHKLLSSFTENLDGVN